jgi:lipoic acid synthetase
MKKRLPDWIKVKLPTGTAYAHLKSRIAQAGTHTVCEEAHCPNLGECWSRKVATIMILGDKCTRSCRYCNVAAGKPVPLDGEEPARVAKLVQELGLQYAVITSVTRDDLKDGGAAVFAGAVKAIHESGTCKVEVLTPDYLDDNLHKVLASKPEVFGHNIETVRRMFPHVKSKGSYARSLRVLEQVKLFCPDQATKSGLMIGLGERVDEIHEAMADLRNRQVDILTIGQYLQPGKSKAPVIKFYTPEEFRDLARAGKALGFQHVESGPLVRSSYRADRQYKDSEGRA